jgi:hypothetical protein
LLCDNWMKGSDIDNSSLWYTHKRPSVYNILLQFGGKVLLEHNRIPVCNYNDLLRWNDLTSDLGEDLFTTSFLAAKDIRNCFYRHSFIWKKVIDHDNTALNQLFNREMADLHFHLKGSSYNFELNWMSLMNNITNREKEFKTLSKHYQEPKLQLADNEENVSLYLDTIKACAIRYLLFTYLKGYSLSKEERKTWMNLLRCKSTSLVYLYLPFLERKLSVAKYLFGKEYEHEVVDYAISPYPVYEEEAQKLLSVLTGERWLMYEMFRRIYSDEYSGNKVTTLFYAYLVIKSNIRHEFIQLNKKIGFSNFAQYECRKGLFLKEGSIFDTLVSKLAIASFFLNKPPQSKRYLEVRITPKEKSSDLAAAISKIDNDVRKKVFPYYNKWNYNYILHFIKEKEKTDKKDFLLDFIPRHYLLRKKIKKETLAIGELWKSTSPCAGKLVGVDAANSEIFCRPEVFAQAYRYLRDLQPENDLEFIKKIERHTLGFTYHVGEDFLDIVDGLRALDEALIFLNLKQGDRLGHALVLGIDAEDYYKKKNYTIVMPQQVFLDNTVWLYIKGRQYQLDQMHNLEQKLKKWYEIYYRKIFNKNDQLPTLFDYYQSWLLRGDDPQCYSSNGKSYSSKATPWEINSLNNLEEVIQARENTMAQKLFYHYQFDEDVKRNGDLNSEYKVNPLFISVVKELQQKILKEIELKSISIETNLTSNLRIGNLPQYKNHPIQRFYNHSIQTNYPTSAVSVSINTDDLGIFATSLEREYSLLALAMEKEEKNSPRDIYEWLDKIREMGLEQKFGQ